MWVPLLWLPAALVASPVRAAETPRETPGETVFKVEKCGLCHGVAATGLEAKTKSEKLKGPDLSGFKTEDPIRLAAYLRQQEIPESGKHKRPFKGTDEELQALLDWLGSLEAPAGEP